MKDLIQPFIAKENLTKYKKFDAFIDWAIPNGQAGINHIHHHIFNINDPFFRYSDDFLPSGHNTTRSWFIKIEHCASLKQTIIIRRNGTYIIKEPDRMISGAKFISFVKAYMNAIIYYRSIKSPSKSLYKSLLYIEKALRELNNGNNHPALINRACFVKALSLVNISTSCQSIKYDIGKDLEMLAGMMQAGYHSKSFRYVEHGFNLIYRRFKFTSNIAQQKRRKYSSRNPINISMNDSARLTNEDIACIGLSYNKSIITHGAQSEVSYIASAVGLTFTTTSMRMGELLILKRDCVFFDKNKNRYLLRIDRPKINESQCLPIPSKLGNLTKEMFNLILNYSHESHITFKFYIDKFNGDFGSINELYIPQRLKNIFKKQYLNLNDIIQIMNISATNIDNGFFPERLNGLQKHLYVNTPGDLIYDSNINFKLNTYVYKIKDLVTALSGHFSIPEMLNKKHYISLRDLSAREYTEKSADAIRSILNRKNIKHYSVCQYIKCDDLKSYLFKLFKENKYPHWPFSTKDKLTRLDQSLMVLPSLDKSPANVLTSEWWRPVALTPSRLSLWISKRKINNYAGNLFKILDIKLKNGDYPNITLHQTRKYHQTESLLAGANEIFIDTLSGRKNGKQSEYYDQRTPHELICQSMETLDPNEEFQIIGPVSEQLPPRKLIYDRMAYLYEEAAPKQITELGGCRADWSINPCEQYGDCMRCNKHIWRKGDKKRLPFIHDLLEYSISMIETAKNKLIYNKTSKSLKRHILLSNTIVKPFS